MAQCPVCNATIPDDFGLMECPSCAAQLIVHMDGRVEHSSGGGEEPAPVFNEPPQEFEFKAHDEFAPTVVHQPEEDSSEENPPGDFAKDPAATEAAVEVATEEPPPPPPASDDTFAMIPDNPATEVYTPGVSAGSSDSPDLSDIARFGNSDQSSGRDGSLRYNVFISGIDTADVREAFREAITDRKLVWDIDQILRSLKNGEVQIQNVTPPKAYILISRLRNIPVQVRWEQYALAQT